MDFLSEYRSCTSQAGNWGEFLAGALSCWRDPTYFSPLTAPHFVVFALLAYWATLLTLHFTLRGRRASFAQSPLFTIIAAAHNAALAIASIVMFIGVCTALVNVSQGAGGVRATLCTPNDSRMPAALEQWIFVFYLSKFWELFDTVLLVLRGRPVTLLHLWHHSSVAVEVRVWLDYGMTFGAYGMWFNTLIHSIMYPYYLCALLKVRFPFKKWITVSQIVQFFTSFVLTLPVFHYNRQDNGCSGMQGLYLSAFFNASFLILFIQFYLRTYKSAKSREAKKKE